jgi:hypothetical protein
MSPNSVAAILIRRENLGTDTQKVDHRRHKDKVRRETSEEPMLLIPCSWTCSLQNC